MIGALFVLLLFLFIFIGIPVSIWRECVRSAKAEKKQKEEDDKWLEAEMLKPKFCLQVTLKDGTVLKTEQVDPELRNYYSRWYSHRLESKPLAERYAYEIVEGKPFRENGHYYPHSVIAKVVVVPQ